MSDLPISVVKDVNGNVYTLDSVLGQGGQGMVCRTKDSSLAIKFVMKGEQILQDEKFYEAYKNKINDVVIMNIDSDINLCHPYTMLEKPYCGYVMHMLSELKPVSNLIYDPNSDNGLSEFFLKTNGLKKRLEVLIELSRTLARLHSKGIVYCDISPNNVFYSNTDNFSKVWIIDCDNLKFSSDPKRGIFTPGYGAPEVASNLTSNTIFSDCFSFAILAFKILTARSPFEVDYTDESSSDGWDASTTEAASQDKIANNDIPWLFENGINDQLKAYFNHFLTKDMLVLFEQTFGKTGRSVPTSRPSMREWYSCLKDIYLKITKCQCGRYIFAGEKDCPFCHEKPQFTYYGTLMEVYPNHKEAANNVSEDLHKADLNDFEYIDKKMASISKQNYKKLYDFMIYEDSKIYNYSINTISIYEFPFPLVEFKFNNGYLFINNKSAKNIKYNYKGEKGSLLSSDAKPISGKDPFYLYIDDPDSSVIHCLIIKSV